MTVVGYAFVLAMRGTDAAVHVEHHDIGRAAVMHHVDPPARQIGERRDIGFFGQNLGLEPPHLTGRGGLSRHGLPTHDPAHRRVSAEPVGVGDVLVAWSCPKTDCRNCAIRLCLLFRPVLLSASAPPTMAVIPSASSSRHPK